MRGPIEGLKGHVFTTLLVVLAGIAVTIVFLVLSGSAFQGDTFKFKATLPTTASLGPGARVTMAGARVGRVSKVEHVGFGTVVSMDITDKRVLPIPVDSKVTLRQRTPVGENYISIAPGGSAKSLTSDSVLPISQATEYVDLDQILSTFQGDAKTRARKLVQGLGAAVEDRGADLNATLGGVKPVVQHAAGVLTVLDDDKRQTVSLVSNLNGIMNAVGDRGAAIRNVADRGLVALNAVSSRDDALRATLDELPSTLKQVQTTSGVLRSTSEVASPVVANLAAALHDLRPAITDLAPAATEGRAVVRQLGLAAKPLTSTFKALQSTSGPLSAALPQVHKAICQVNPMVRYAKPYTDDIIAAIIGLGSASNSYDGVGHLIRLTPIVGENSTSGTLPPSVSKAIYTLTRTGALGKASPLTWDPYPEPGKIGKDAAKAGNTVFDATELAKSGKYTFPHVNADC